jgi:hypothetical protein
MRENERRQHPQFKEKFVNEMKYYGSDLNKLAAQKCRKDIVINNIDLIINDYKQNKIRIIESKQRREDLKIGQKLLLRDVSRRHKIDCYAVFGNYPHDSVILYSFQSEQEYLLDQKLLIDFLDNKTQYK